MVIISIRITIFASKIQTIAAVRAAYRAPAATYAPAADAKARVRRRKRRATPTHRRCIAPISIPI